MKPIVRLFALCALAFLFFACAPAPTSTTTAEPVTSATQTPKLKPAANPLALQPGEYSRFWVTDTTLVEVRYEFDGTFTVGSRLSTRTDTCWLDRAEFNVITTSKDGVTASKQSDNSLKVETNLSPIPVGKFCYEDNRNK